MSKAKGTEESTLVIGGVPRADLLPPEIKASERARSQRRGLVAILIVVIVLVAAGYAGAAVLAQNSVNALDAANARTASILAEQAQYAEVKAAKSSIAAAEAARLNATSTEIDWKTQVAAIVSTLPTGATLVGFESVSSSPTTPLDAPSSPLEGARVVEIKLTVKSSSIPDSAKWIRDLSTLTGFVDATPDTIAADDAESSGQSDLTTTLTLHLNSDVYWNRFSSEATK